MHKNLCETNARLFTKLSRCSGSPFINFRFKNVCHRVANIKYKKKKIQGELRCIHKNFTYKASEHSFSTTFRSHMLHRSIYRYNRNLFLALLDETVSQKIELFNLGTHLGCINTPFQVLKVSQISVRLVNKRPTQEN